MDGSHVWYIWQQQIWKNSCLNEHQAKMVCKLSCAKLVVHFGYAISPSEARNCLRCDELMSGYDRSGLRLCMTGSNQDVCNSLPSALYFEIRLRRLGLFKLRWDTPSPWCFLRRHLAFTIFELVSTVTYGYDDNTPIDYTAPRGHQGGGWASAPPYDFRVFFLFGC